jgi:hypothetical protein
MAHRRVLSTSSWLIKRDKRASSGLVSSLSASGYGYSSNCINMSKISHLVSTDMNQAFISSGDVPVSEVLNEKMVLESITGY